MRLGQKPTGLHRAAGICLLASMFTDSLGQVLSSAPESDEGFAHTLTWLWILEAKGQQLVLSSPVALAKSKGPEHPAGRPC